MGRDRLPKGDSREITVEVRNEHHLRLPSVTMLVRVDRVAPSPNGSLASTPTRTPTRSCEPPQRLVPEFGLAGRVGSHVLLRTPFIPFG
jgi:hypothetical protein